MRFDSQGRKQAIALIMAVAILAVLAVVGYGFASAMRMEGIAASTIKNLSQARFGAYAAMQLFPGVLINDALAQPSTTAGPLAEHFNEALYTSGLSQTLAMWGNLSVLTEQSGLPYYSGTVNLRDESSKINLNAHGNLSKWNYSSSQVLNDGGASAVADPAVPLYHGANQRFSSFEVSIEDFFYKHYTDVKLWGPGDPYELLSTDGARDKKARVRCANLARAICLYRYGGKQGTPDYAGDGKPGAAGVDDEADNDLGGDDISATYTYAPVQSPMPPIPIGGHPTRFGLPFDGIDNDGDGIVDEEKEGFDEPDEFNPYRPRGDDKKIDSVEELKNVFGHTYGINGTDAFGSSYGVTVPAAVNYTGSLTPEQITAESERVYGIVKGEFTVSSYSLDIRSVSIDPPSTDGYDNDGDGLVDDADNTGVSILAALLQEVKTVAQGGSAKSIYQVNINERDIDKPTQAAYMFLKLSQPVTYKKTDGTTVTQALVPGITLKTCLDIIDYRDTDCVPTKLRVDNQNDATVLGITLGKDYYGMESLHVTDVGRYIAVDQQFISEAPPWNGTGTITYTVQAADDTPEKRTSTISVTDAAKLKPGAYLVKLTVNVPAGSITFKDSTGTITKDATVGGGTFYFGPLNVDATGKGSFQVIASNNVGVTFTLSNFQILLPYVEVSNWGRKARDMSQFSLEIEDIANPAKKMTVPLTSGVFAATSNPANGEAGLPAQYVPRHKKLIAGFDTAQIRGPHGIWYGSMVCVYSVEAFERNFPVGWGNQNGIWGDAPGEDFPLWQVGIPGSNTVDPFYNGFDGTQKIRLKLTTTLDLLAGGPIDFYTDTGPNVVFSAANLSAGRVQLGGDLSFAFTQYGLCWAVNIPGLLPGRWKNNLTAAGNAGLWPPTVASFAGQNNSRDAIVISDSGYYYSVGQLKDVSNHKIACQTLSLYTAWDTAWQPILAYLQAYCVSGRCPARININTASPPVMAGAFVGARAGEPTDAALAAGRPYVDIRTMSDVAAIKGAYLGNAGDDDGCNEGDDDGEQFLWIYRYSNIFTLRSDVFSVQVCGSVRNPKGARATAALATMYDRGSAIDASGKPVVRLLQVGAVTE